MYIVVNSDDNEEHDFEDVSLARRRLVALSKEGIKAYILVERDQTPRGYR